MRCSGTARAATDVDSDISILRQKLAGFDTAWDIVARSCDELEEWLTLAHLTNTVCDALFRRHVPPPILNHCMQSTLPEFRQLLETKLNRTRKVFLPLMECMRAYSLGESPTL